MRISTFFPFSAGQQNCSGLTFGGLGHCALSGSRCFNQSAFLELCLILLGSPLSSWASAARRKDSRALKWRGTAGVSVAAGPGLPGGGGPFHSQPGSYVPNLCESLRNACLLCIGGFREQNLNYDVTITILASNICFVSV